MALHPEALPAARAFVKSGSRWRRLRTFPVIAMIFAVGLLPTTGRGARADDPVVVKLTLHPARIDELVPPPRLLPADPELKPGNAAVVLLRMPWEQRAWMQEWLPQLAEIAKLSPDDPRVAEFPFNRFAGEMRRAAFIRDAEWNYPLDDEPLDEILLPDLQGLRQFVGLGMSVWVNQQIATGNLESAREGVLVQLACARHVGRTPLLINQLVAAAIADQGLDSLERVVGAPDCPNLQTSLRMLPDALSSGVEAVQWAAVFEERSLPMKRDGVPRAGDSESWTRVFDTWLERWMALVNPPSPETRSAIRARIAVAGRKAFALEPPTDLDLETASDDEIAMRFLLVTFRQIHEATEMAWRLEQPDAIAALVPIDARVSELEPVFGGGLLSFLAHPLNWYLPIHRFGRRARMLEVVEALRDSLARNGGRFPASLAEVPARVPLDPFTGKPFLYEPAADGRSARLATPPIPGVADPRSGRVYELTIGSE